MDRPKLLPNADSTFVAGLARAFAADVEQVLAYAPRPDPPREREQGGAMQFYYQPVSSYSRKALISARAG